MDRIGGRICRLELGRHMQRVWLSLLFELRFKSMPGKQLTANKCSSLSADWAALNRL